MSEHLDDSVVEIKEDGKVTQSTSEPTSLPVLRKSRRGDRLLVVVLSLATLLLAFWPRAASNDIAAAKVRARVQSVNNELVQTYGIVQQGDQEVTVEILSGEHKGAVVTAFNTLLGDPEFDWVFATGEEALVSLTGTGETLRADLLGPYRLRAEGILVLIFFVLLLVVGGWVGAKAILSFAFSVLLVWRVLLPLSLRGYDPVIISLLVVAILTGAITFLVGGVNRKGATAFLGGFLGLVTTCVLAFLFAPALHVTGATRPFAKSLAFVHPGMDLYRFVLSGIFIASSGAVMDLAMDIAAALQEIKLHHPRISRKALFVSGMTVSRAVVGTMTTTLLLAYSGGYMVMLLYFMHQDIPTTVMFNSPFFASEALSILVGSFGLVTVAPFSALVGSFLFTRRSGEIQQTS